MSAEVQALIERFDRLRNGGVCSPTTRGLLDEAESLLRSLSTPPADDVREALGEHVEGVMYADDIPEGTDYLPGTTDPIPDDYERHFCQEDGEDWPCSTARVLDEQIPGEPFTLGDLARQHEKIAETPSLMAQTVPDFHALTAKALCWVAEKLAAFEVRPYGTVTDTEEEVSRAEESAARVEAARGESLPITLFRMFVREQDEGDGPERVTVEVADLRHVLRLIDGEASS